MSPTPLFTAPSPSAPAPATTKYVLPPPDKLALLISNSKSTKQLLKLHGALYRHNLHQHPSLNFHLLRSYSSLNCLHYSITLFNQNSNPNIFLYTAIIHCLAQQNLHQQALLYYSQLLADSLQPNAFTFSSILKSCPLKPGKSLHSQAIKFGFDEDLYVRTCLVDVYARGGDILSAKKLFDTMPEKNLVSSTAMLTCYAKHGQIAAARELFDEFREKDVVCWNVMIDGYTQHGFPNEALALFRRMLKTKVRPNEVTAVAALSACGQIGALESGRWIHSYIENLGIKLNVQVGTALIDMYSKCGSLEDARLIFDKVNDKDVVAWNSMIVGYAMHGFTIDAIRLFNEMLRIGLKPTDITFIGILNACAHAGLVDEGWRFFNSMKDEHAIEPKVEHYGCMVNLLGRCGQVEEANKLIKNMKVQPDSVMWGTLLGACSLHGNIDLGEEIAEYLVSQNLANSGTYILLSNIYAAKGNWDGVAKVRTLMKDSGVQKEPGCSSIEVNNKVHEFLAGDLRHPKSKDIYMMLDKINGWLKARGYTPKTDIVLHNIVEEQKEQSLEVHSEKLAIAFGLISTQPGTTIKIVKNLRVCPDCHAVTKLISKITGRKILMRDRNRFHHFVNGSCACGDYW
ncbi:pentatricopeptide repeat-containing protein ELI1, chloroplastic [Mangifera indica]|uniref:pentatricopeptide repeat-containing protein ELI1, chloroplastic n=1 Tax=Mangifera indica TaxID=29780 RepID=UPI001CFBCAB3|nr:pentatricopeptide repeat-containing protein ELI1, chloroplastic [Mangifera indica]